MNFATKLPVKGYRCVDLSSPIHEGRPTVILYILLIAVLNLGLGFIAAMHLGRCYKRLALSSPYSEAVSAQQQTVAAPIDATSEDFDEEANDAAGEEAVDADSEGSSEKPPKESADGPMNGDSDEFAADIDALFEEIGS